MAKLQNIYPSHFNTFKIRFSQNRIIDLEKDSDQEEEILKTHNRAHRNAYENQKQIAEKYYFPRMKAKITNIVKQCRVCKEEKYDR